MGFLFHAIKVPKVITLTFFLNLISHAHYLLIGALTRLGLYKQPPPEESPESSANPNNNYIFILDRSSPSLVPIPVRVVTAAIKNRVPVVEYQEFLLRGGAAAEEEEESERKCSICLECIEGRHEIRELCNCRHLFHRECLDTWIDEGQVTCPLCRSMLLPPRVNLFRCKEREVLLLPS